MSNKPFFEIATNCVRPKTISILILLSIIHFNCFSQINKGQWLAGGNAAFSYSQAKVYTENIKVSTFTFSPSAGYFFLNRFAGGLKLDIGIESNHYNYGKERNTIYSFVPFVRYYFLPPEQKLNFFAELGYGFSFGHYKNFYDLDYNYHSTTLSFRTGAAVFLNGYTALEVTLGYNHSSRGPIDSAATNTIQIGIGFQIHLGRKKD